MLSRSFLTTAIVAVASLSSVALADTTLRGHNLNSSTGLGTGNNGGYSHRFWETGPAVNSATVPFTGGLLAEGGASTTVYTFCMDPNYLNTANPATYHIIPVTDAPFPATGNATGLDYTTVHEAAVNATALAAESVGLMDSRGFLTTAFQTSRSSNVTISGFTFTKAKWIEGLQTKIWQNLGISGGSLNAGNLAVRNAIDSFRTPFLNAGIRVRVLGVDLGGNRGQDQLCLVDQERVLIPLPPAAFAGMGALACVACFGVIRRRKNAAV